MRSKSRGRVPIQTGIRLDWLAVGALVLLVCIGTAEVESQGPVKAFSEPVNSSISQQYEGGAPALIADATWDQPSLEGAPRWSEHFDSATVSSAIPELTASAVFAVDLTAGMLLYQHGADTRLAPASTLKMITALTALEVLSPTEEVTIEVGDLVDREVYSNAALDVGDLVSVRELLAGTLIPSGGDASRALARVAGERLGPAQDQDPVERFVDEMNLHAERLGMVDSHFVNATGVDHPEQQSSARDLAVAAQAVLRDPLLGELVAMERVELSVGGPNARTIELHNTNQLLSADRVHGVKTGTTGEAGENLVLATRRAGNQVLAVVLGSEDRYADVQRLMDHLDSEITWLTFGASDEFQGVLGAQERFDFEFGATITRPVASSSSADIYAVIELNDRQSVASGRGWGQVVFFQGGVELYRLPLIAPG